MAKKVVKDKIDHKVEIAVTENVPPGMYLRQEIGKGTSDDGRDIEISTTGPTLIIWIGKKFPHGRQFTVNVADMAQTILTALDAGESVPKGPHSEPTTTPA